MRPSRPPAVIVTCEHARHAVPRALASRFAGREAWLRGHGGWDPGAEAVARRLASALEAPLFVGELSRLVVDLNRPEGHPRLFSEATRGLPPERREALLAEVHRPYWRRVREAIHAAPAGVPVLHLAVHSFDPELDPEGRAFDVGLLYDPGRETERRVAGRVAASLEGAGLGVRRNAPYRGVSAGLTTSLRRLFPDARYAGLEIELSQARVARGGAGRRRIAEALVGALLEAA